MKNFENLKSELQTVELENRLEMVQMAADAEAGYKCQASVEVETD